MDKISIEMSNIAIKIDKLFNSFFAEIFFSSQTLLESMRYSTIEGGKKLRPYLLYTVAKKFNIDEEVALYIGACVELLHAYTLMHDDLPCMDDDDTRRGKPSNHIQFNEFTAVLSGDALQSEAFYLLSNNKLNLDAQTKLDIINVVAEIIGGRNLISGQMLDLDFQKNNISIANIDSINQIHLLKTAKLISLCVLIPAIIAKKDIAYKTKLANYGEKLGLLYQIVDDYHDSKNTEEQMNIFNALGFEQAMEKLQTTNQQALSLLQELGLEELEAFNNFIMQGVQ